MVTVILSVAYKIPWQAGTCREARPGSLGPFPHSCPEQSVTPRLRGYCNPESSPTCPRCRTKLVGRGGPQVTSAGA